MKQAFLILSFIFSSAIASAASEVQDFDLNQDGKIDISVQFANYIERSYFMVFDHWYGDFNAYPAEEAYSLTPTQWQSRWAIFDIREYQLGYFYFVKKEAHTNNLDSLVKFLTAAQAERFLNVAAHVLELDIRIFRDELFDQSPKLNRCENSAVVLTLDLLKKSAAGSSKIRAEDSEVKVELAKMTNVLSEKSCRCLPMCQKLNEQAKRLAFIKEFAAPVTR